MNDIVPSTKLKMVSVHKLKSLACPRYYYWRQVRNLESVYLRVYYWYGSVLAAGWETLLMGKSWRQAQAAMNVEDKRFRQRYVVSQQDKDEMHLHRQVIDVMLRVAVKQPDFKDLKIVGKQESFRVRLKRSKLWFVGTKDGDGFYKGNNVLLENKAIIAGMVNDQLFRSLEMDMQINGYAYSDRLRGLDPLDRCMYCVFKKTQKRMKKAGWKCNGKGPQHPRPQTETEFAAEIEESCEQLPESHYDWRLIRMGKTAVDETGHDIETAALELKLKYDRLGEDGVLDPHEWRRETSCCSLFSGCEYLPLCKNPKRAAIYKDLFQMREIRYDDEVEELQT